MCSLGFDQTSFIRAVGYRLAATGANRINRGVFPSPSIAADSKEVGPGAT
jgi:hypothetical protein